jgi:hypothetical protein
LACAEAGLIRTVIYSSGMRCSLVSHLSWVKNGRLGVVRDDSDGEQLADCRSRCVQTGIRKVGGIVHEL